MIMEISSIFPYVSTNYDFSLPYISIPETCLHSISELRICPRYFHNHLFIKIFDSFL